MQSTGRQLFTYNDFCLLFAGKNTHQSVQYAKFLHSSVSISHKVYGLIIYRDQTIPLLLSAGRFSRHEWFGSYFTMLDFKNTYLERVWIYQHLISQPMVLKLSTELQ